MDLPSKHIVRKSKQVVVDASVSEIVFAEDARERVKVTDLRSSEKYEIKRSPVKRTLQMTG